MSDPINVIFHSPSTFKIGPLIYLHWGRLTIIKDLTDSLPRMRTGDVDYASARFIGCCHEKISGSNNIGCSNLFIEKPSSPEDDTSIYSCIISEIPSDMAKVNVDIWKVELDGETIQLPAENAVSELGFIL